MNGRRVGVYELKREIGRGGMGAVYLAERADGEFRQTVAVKLIKRGMDTDLILKRFRRERQIIAALDHPNIVYFLAGGSTNDGLPYFVMEFIDGKPLYEFCGAKKLSIEDRLKIFRQICDAVETAHQKKVIHRDLKPSNILVKPDGTPKLLDFGIAKVLDPDLAVTEIDPTATAMRVMTPEYASPEQVTGDEITPASDIYSLGVILYEILTGHRPYKLNRRVPFEVARVICEEAPSRPSAQNTDAEMQIPTLEFISQSGNLAAESANSKFKIQNSKFDELDRIVLKALRKNPKERYKSANALGEDIENFLKNRPVKAEVFLSESAGKTAKDKKSAAIMPFKLLSADTGKSTDDIFLGIGLADALVSRLSGVRRLILRPTSSVMRFSEGEDFFAAGRELAVEFVVEGTIRRVGERIRITARLLDVYENSMIWSENFDENFTDALELEDSLSEKIAKSLLPKLTGEEEKQLNKRGTNNHDAYEAYLRGRAYWSLQTEEGFSRSINFYRQAVEHDPEYAQAWIAIAEYYIFLGIHCFIPFAESTNAAREAAQKALRFDPTIAEGYATFGFVAASGDFEWEESEELFLKALKLNPNSLMAHFWYTALLTQTGRFKDALEQSEKVLEFDPNSLLAVHMYAWVLYHSRAFDRSVELYRKMLPDEPNYAWGIQTYSWALRQVGEFDEAVKQAARAVQITGKNPLYLSTLAAAYADAGEREKTFEILNELDEISTTRYVSPYMLAFVYCALNDKDKAFDLLEKSLAARDDWMRWLAVEPQFDVLRDDPRYQNLLRRTGNPLAKSFEKYSTYVQNQQTGDKNSIAVLPLKIFGSPTGTGEEEYLGIGLADALVTRLSNVRRLTVRPTSSVLPFADSGANPFEAGRALDVRYILDGSIRRAGERIRVSVQLLNVAGNSSNWAENFNEHFTDVLELEDSISEKVIKSLLPQLTGEDERQMNKRGTNSSEAYEAYLRGRFYWNQFTPDALFKAKEAFETAIRIDPNYALAYVGMTDIYIWSNIYGMIPSAEAVLLAQENALRAIAIDVNLGEAYASLGLTFQNRFEWQKGYEAYERAISLTPNYVHAHEWFSASLIGHGNTDKGVEEIKIAERLDPFSLRTKTLTAWTLYQAHRFDESLERGRQIVESDQNYPQGYSQIGINLLALGRIEEALPHLQRFDQMIPDSALAKYQLCFAYAAVGRRDSARKVFEDIKNLASHGYVKPFFLGMAHAALEEFNEAFPFFEQASDESEPWMLWFGTEPMLEKLHADAHFVRLLEKMNNPLAVKVRINQEKNSIPKNIAKK